MGQLEFKNYSLRIADKQLINKVSFHLDAGKTLAIIGESGSGKTLLTKSIVGNFPQGSQRSGNIIFEGQDLLTFQVKQWQAIRGRQISYIAQNPMAVFNPMQTIGSHGVELLKSVLGIRKKEAYQRLVNAFEQYNLLDGVNLIHKYPFQLSGGMLQRIMLAMMMELSPKLIIADEPTSALDRSNKDTVIETLNRCKAKGVSLIIVTHDYYLMQKLAEDIIVFRESEIIEWGKASDVLNHPKSEYSGELVEASFINIKNPMYGS